ncbi:MAG: valine--tRNA ligase [Maritimibacter sp.]
MAIEKNFDAAAAEPRITKKWLDAKAFAAGANASRKETFTVMIPPPNVTGALHVGHAFNNTLQDILVRWHRMRGFDTLWQPGQDHAGIATQLQVEKMLTATQQPSRSELGREAFLEKVWDWKGQYGSTIVEQLKRLGSSCDWDRNAFTMAGAPGDPKTGHENSPDFHDAVIKVFVEMHEKGLIYRGKRLVNWDPHFETAISDLEVENIEVAGHMWHFKYPLAGGETYTYVEKDEDGNVTLTEERDYISIATTRPETMLGDGAVAVHMDDERYAPIVGKLVEIPVGPKEFRRLIPIITDEYPDMAFGSGAVKITGAHDFNDYEVAKRAGLPMYRLMDTRGAMRSDGLSHAESAAVAMEVAHGKRVLGEEEADAINLVPEELRGLDRFEARKAVIDQINAEGLAVMVTETLPYVENKPIMQPFGDRSKVVIEPMLTDQWYVDAQKVVGPALEAVESGRVEILPESGKKVYFHWLNNIEPWCISRQLWWGHQIPVWYGLDLSYEKPVSDDGDLDEVEILKTLVDGMVHLGSVHHCAAHFDEVISAFKDEIADTPTPINHARVIEVEDRAAATQAFAEGLAAYNVSQDPTKLVYPVWRDADVLDTWFSSGLWPFGTLGWPKETPELAKYFPTDVLITGQDILFFWVARMMMMSHAVMDQDPFHTVYLHQLVRDEKGKKMSKTTGNVIDPLEIIDEFGADALRMTNASMAAIGGVLKLSKERITGYRNFGTKLWNASKFAQMNDCQPAPDFDPAAVEGTVNKWIIGETARARIMVDEALAAYRFNDAANGLYAFIWGKVCDWYVEFAKPLFSSEDAAVVAETRATMAWVLDQCLVLLHPIMPFITEELWGEIAPRAKMLVHADWPTYGDELIDADADREMNWVIKLIEDTRSARAQMHVPAGLKIPVILQDLDAAGRAAWDTNETLIKRLARIESLTEMADLPKGCVTIPVEGGTFALPLADIIDVDEEKARLEKTLGKLAKEIGGLKGRLNNPKFAQSAPAEVVEETKANLDAREAEAGKLEEALARLAEIG